MKRFLKIDVAHMVAMGATSALFAGQACVRHCAAAACVAVQLSRVGLGSLCDIIR